MQYRLSVAVLYLWFIFVSTFSLFFLGSVSLSFFKSLQRLVAHFKFGLHYYQHNFVYWFSNWNNQLIAILIIWLQRQKQCASRWYPVFSARYERLPTRSWRITIAAWKRSPSCKTIYLSSLYVFPISFVAGGFFLKCLVTLSSSLYGPLIRSVKGFITQPAQMIKTGGLSWVLIVRKWSVGASTNKPLLLFFSVPLHAHHFSSLFCLVSLIFFSFFLLSPAAHFFKKKPPKKRGIVWNVKRLYWSI